MTLREKQSLFVSLITRLLVFGLAKGYEFTFGDTYATSGHMPNSLHGYRLAADLNLFIGGKWISDGRHPDWQELGAFWESLDPLCRWGGRFKKNDANHFSLTHEGRS